MQTNDKELHANMREIMLELIACCVMLKYLGYRLRNDYIENDLVGYFSMYAGGMAGMVASMYVIAQSSQNSEEIQSNDMLAAILLIPVGMLLAQSIRHAIPESYNYTRSLMFSNGMTPELQRPLLDSTHADLEAQEQVNNQETQQEVNSKCWPLY